MSVLTVSRRVLIASLIATPAFAGRAAHTPAHASSRRISVTVAIDRHGRPTPQWIDLIRDRIDANELAGVRINPRALSGGDSQWIAAIRTAAPAWIKNIGQLDAPFGADRPPAVLAVVVGNGGGDDAFSTAPNLIAFDLAALDNAYGAVDPAALPRLVGRLLSREYTRLRLNAYLDGNGWTPEWAARDPLLAALRNLYVQGLATLRGIEGDPRWLAADSRLTPEAKSVLATLQPVMVERLKGLSAKPSPQVANAWLHDMSQGPLDRRWGALPIALWLATDTGYDAGRVAAWIEGKPDGLLQLAAGQADRKYQRALTDLQSAATDRIAEYR